MKEVSTISLIIFALFTVSCKNELPNRMITISDFQSAYVEDRTVAIYLPPNYYAGNSSYPVLYMHDGQMLFDSTTTWNGQEWGIDETLDDLVANGAIGETILVAIWNGDALRHSEYFPQKPFESLAPDFRDSLYRTERSEGTPLFAAPVQSDSYLKFIVEELKPYIDDNYRTNPGQSDTFIGGSSMGGLISMYAICEYPEVFGGAICMSTHWPGSFETEDNPIPAAFTNYLKSKLPDPSNHKLYFDYGTETLDSIYEPYQLEVDEVIRKQGYDDDAFLSLKFEGHEHAEKDWNRRLHIPLKFHLKN